MLLALWTRDLLSRGIKQRFEVSLVNVSQRVCTQDQADVFSKLNHIGRVVTAEEVAAAVVFLCSAGCHLTGEEIVVDGGIIKLGYNVDLSKK